MIVKRYFKCSECGETLPATSTKKNTKEGHVKHMYCFKCKKVTMTVQEVK